LPKLETIDQIQARLKCIPLDDQRIKINVEIKQDLLLRQGQRKMC
jgi:hypothetical protein